MSKFECQSNYTSLYFVFQTKFAKKAIFVKKNRFFHPFLQFLTKKLPFHEYYRTKKEDKSSNLLIYNHHLLILHCIDTICQHPRSLQTDPRTLSELT